MSASPPPSSHRYRGVYSPWVAVLLVALHVALRPLLDPWLNAPRDLKVFIAAALLALPLLLAAFALYRAIRPRPFR